jgi:hypothetical protein
MADNIESLANLETNLKAYGYSLETLPWVMQYNKRDLPTAVPIEEMQAKLNKYGVPYFEAVAYKGEGVMKTLKGLSQLVIDKLNKEYGRGASAGAAAPAARPATAVVPAIPKPAPVPPPPPPAAAPVPPKPVPPPPPPAAAPAPPKPAPAPPPPPPAAAPKPAPAPAAPAASAAKKKGCGSAAVLALGLLVAAVWALLGLR